ISARSLAGARLVVAVAPAAMLVTAVACIAVWAVAACLRAAIRLLPRARVLCLAVVAPPLRLRSARRVAVEPTLRQILSEQSLDLLQQRSLVVRHERDCETFFTGAPRAADPVHVVLRYFRHVVVHDVRQ